jgi:hypothetical protein
MLVSIKRLLAGEKGGGQADRHETGIFDAAAALEAKPLQAGCHPFPGKF